MLLERFCQKGEARKDRVHSQTGTGKNSEAYDRTGSLPRKGEGWTIAMQGAPPTWVVLIWRWATEVRGKERWTAVGKDREHGKGWSLQMRTGLSGGLGEGAASSPDSRDFTCGLQQVLLHVTFDQLKPQADLAGISQL